MKQFIEKHESTFDTLADEYIKKILYFERIIGKKANKKIKKDTAIQWEDIF